MDNKDEYTEERELAGDDAYERRLEGLGVAQEKVRTHNRQLILKYLREHGPALRADMAKSLGLSRATVTIIIQQLLEKKLVLAEQKTHLASGKLTVRVKFNADFGHIIGIDLGRSRLRVYLTNLAATIVDQSAESFDANINPEEGLSLIALNASELVNKNLAGWDSVRGIGMGIPGSVNREETKVISPPMLQHWSNTNIPDKLRELLKKEKAFPIHLGNDANMGALGESRYGRGHGVRNVIYVKLSTAISAGLILNGELYRGESGVAGAFGHIRIQFGKELAKDGPFCASCGESGCLEALNSLHAIVNEVHKNSSSALYHSIPESNITPEHMAEIIIEAQRGDIASRTALENAGTRIGVAIGSYLINVYNPALILLDGGIVRPSKGRQVYINNLLLEKLKQSAKESSLAVAWSGTSISLGQLEDDAVGLGAVATVIDRDPALNMSAAI